MNPVRSARVTSCRPPPSARTAVSFAPHRTASSGSASSRRSRSRPRSTSGRPPSPVSPSSNRTVACSSRIRTASPPAWTSLRNPAHRPAARRATWPESSWMSSMPPWERAARDASRSNSAASIPCTRSVEDHGRGRAGAGDHAAAGRRARHRPGLALRLRGEHRRAARRNGCPPPRPSRVRGRSPSTPQQDDTLAVAQGEASAKDHPSIVAAGGELVSGTGRARQRRALEVLVNGIATTPAPG